VPGRGLLHRQAHSLPQKIRVIVEAKKKPFPFGVSKNKGRNYDVAQKKGCPDMYCDAGLVRVRNQCSKQETWHGKLLPGTV
jgi:hypothetical protein